MGKYVEVVISAEAQYDAFSAYRGDTVAFVAAADTVLHIEDQKVFGASRFEIPAGRRLELIVQEFATRGGVVCITLVGNLEAPHTAEQDPPDGPPVTGVRFKSDVGGEVKPPPDRRGG